MKQFPAAWIARMNEMVKAVRRRQGWGDIQAFVEAPLRPGHPPTLRLEKEGTLIIVPLEIRAVEQMMRTGQEGPVLGDLKRAFLQVMKAAQRRQKGDPASASSRKTGS